MNNTFQKIIKMILGVVFFLIVYTLATMLFNGGYILVSMILFLAIILAIPIFLYKVLK